MSYVSSRRRAVCACLTAIAASAAFSAPAPAAEPDSAGCPTVPVAQAFGPWQDFAEYFLAPAGNIETGGAGWDLTGGAAAVEGNERFHVGGADDHLSMRLPAGGTATTARFCIGLEHRSMRFFVRASGKGRLRVEAIYAKRTSNEKSVRIASISAGESWAPSPIVPMIVNEIAPAHDNALAVSLRFVAEGNAEWQIDDVYVDPFRKS